MALKDHCSVIYNNTLYTYQPDAFQALELRVDGKWTQLPMGVSTNGSVCTQGSPNGVDSLFIVGGSTDSTNPSAKDYSGLQRFKFKDREWEQLETSDPVAQERVGHSAIYLTSTSSILIYAGSQEAKPKMPSSQTFTVSALPPYTVLAHASNVQPLVRPLLLQLNASHALMVGGSPHNKDLYTFSPSEDWQKFNVQLTDAIKNSSEVQATISDLSDGSKILELFDFSVSPTSVSTLDLGNPGGNIITSRSAEARSQRSSRKRKRQNAQTGRPPYNSTLASKSTRLGFSLAQDPDGLVVVSGGTLDSTEYPLLLFSQTGNEWIDPVQFFQTKSESPGPTPTALLPTVTQALFTSSTSAPNHGNDSNTRPLTIVGATLGAVFGLAAVIIILILLFRCFRTKNKTKKKRRTSEYALGDKQEMDFANRSAFMAEGDSSMITESNHKPMGSGHSVTSLAIMSGTARAGSSPRSKRGFFHKPADSGGSTKSFFSRTKSPLAPSPTPNPATGSPEPRTAPRTDTGWSRYFANNSNLDLSQSPAGNTRHDSSRTTTYSSNSQSDYASSRITSNAHVSAEVQPLSLRTNNLYPANSRVVSPTSGLPLPGLVLSPDGDPPSPSTLVSDPDDEEYPNEQVARHDSEGMASWTPVGASDRGSTWTERPISSLYADSMIYPHPGERVRIPNFPRVPSTAHSTAQNSQVEPVADPRGMRSVASRDLRNSPVEAQDRELPEVGSRRVAQPQLAYGNTPTLGINHTPRVGPHEPEDMSWLNLGR